jgi:hypothetical protein
MGPLPHLSSTPTGYSTFDGVMVPGAGRTGRFYGTDQWNEGEFFRSEMIDYDLVADGLR